MTNKDIDRLAEALAPKLQHEKCPYGINEKGAETLQRLEKIMPILETISTMYQDGRKTIKTIIWSLLALGLLALLLAGLVEKIKRYVK